jgi:hypothetical protein
MHKWVLSVLVVMDVSSLTKHRATKVDAIQHHVDDAWYGISFAVGVNTGSGVQDKRIPVLLRTWLSPYWHASRFLILSDSADPDLRVTAVPPKYFCSQSGDQSLHETLLDASPEVFTKSWKYVKNKATDSWRKRISKSSFRCMQFRFLYILPELYKRWPKSDYFFLADDDAFVNWPGVLRAMSAFQPEEAAIVGFSGGNKNPCGPENGGEFSFYGGLFGLTRSAVALFQNTITDTASKFAFFRLHGCNHAHDYGSALPNFWRGCSTPTKILEELWTTCSGLLQQLDSSKNPSNSAITKMQKMGCMPEHAVRDFDQGRYIYSNFKGVDDNDDIIISFWAMEFTNKVRRVSWPCLADGMLPKFKTLFPHGGDQDWDPIWHLGRDLHKGREVIAIHHAQPGYQQMVYCLLQKNHLQPAAADPEGHCH